MKDEIQTIEGTTFRPNKTKIGNEEIEHWLAQRLNPRIDFRIYEFSHKGKNVILFEIPATNFQPIRFFHEAYIRIGSITRKLKDFPEKEAKIWNKKTSKAFEKEIAKRNLTTGELTELLDTNSYFDLMQLPYPSNRTAVVEKFISEEFIIKTASKYSITNLGAILFAKNLNDFDIIYRKAVRIIIYKDKNRVFTEREYIENKGYAAGFKNMLDWINSHLPANEEMGRAFRRKTRMYPEIAVRELVGNIIIHQDFKETGTGPIVEIFNDRIEFTNPGLPLITTERFIDEFQSRNEILASFLRRVNICEEKGSGIDKVITFIELYQLPAPDFQVKEKHTKAVLFSFKTLNDMDKKDKIRATYQHACMCYVSNEKMTNQSLRERFKIEEKNSAIASRIIKDALKVELIKEDDPESKS